MSLWSCDGSTHVTVVGGGLAGCECAWQLAERGIEVILVEQRPVRRSPVHQTDWLGELVCSNSLRAMSLTNAVGLLKEELRRCGSVVMRVAEATRVQAGGALAVDRAEFASRLQAEVQGHRCIQVVREPCLSVPEHRPCVIATGPLTSDDLAADLSRKIGADALFYYDAIAPIVEADSIDWDCVFRQSRYDSGEAVDETQAYVNCPLDEGEYHSFVAALREADRAACHAFEQLPYFEGCLPIEVMAERGEMTLAFGPMKPVGLTDPRTGRRPFAVVQLRAEDRGRTAYNLVGFQTRMTHDAQRRVLTMVPGLERARFCRLGSMHRNTFVDAPRVLDIDMQLRALAGVYLAGQIAGVEGYVESTACGLVCGIRLASRMFGKPVPTPPPSTAIGGLLGHLASPHRPFQPSNITWAHLLPLEGETRKKDRKRLMIERALRDVEQWVSCDRLRPTSSSM